MKSYCDGVINVLGEIKVKAIINSVETFLPLLVTESERNPLLGRNWIKTINLNLNEFLKTNYEVSYCSSEKSTTSSNLENLFNKYPKVFSSGLGKIENLQASLALRQDAKPVFFKARPVAFAVRDAVSKEIDKLVSENVLEKVDHSEWATPIVPVKKSGGNVRLCGDYKITVNPNLIIDEHPLPTVEELFANVAGGDKFSKIDLSQAYLQLEVNPCCREILTLSTHKGLFRPTRLMYGVASAPAIFQRLIEQILQGIPGVTAFIDDIRITGPNDEMHLQRLEEVLKRLEKYNLRVNNVAFSKTR